MIINALTTATAFLIEEGESARWKISTLFLFLMVDMAEARRITAVTVLTPPAVPTGEPPMNIRTREITVVAPLRFS